MWDIKKCCIILFCVCKGCIIEDQIVFELNLSDITSKFCSVPMFIILVSQTVFLTSGMFVIYFNTETH